MSTPDQAFDPETLAVLKSVFDEACGLLPLHKRTDEMRDRLPHFEACRHRRAQSYEIAHIRAQRSFVFNHRTAKPSEFHKKRLIRCPSYSGVRGGDKKGKSTAQLPLGAVRVLRYINGGGSLGNPDG